MQQRWGERECPLPPEIALAQQHYTDVEAVDGLTLDALIRKMGLLKDLPQNPLAGKITGLLNLGSRLPSQLWYEADPKTNDQRFWPQILSALQAGSLLIFDLGSCFCARRWKMKKSEPIRKDWPQENDRENRGRQKGKLASEHDKQDFPAVLPESVSNLRCSRSPIWHEPFISL